MVNSSINKALFPRGGLGKRRRRPENRPFTPKRKESSSNHHFSGAMLNFGVAIGIGIGVHCQKRVMMYYPQVTRTRSIIGDWCNMICFREV